MKLTRKNFLRQLSLIAGSLGLGVGIAKLDIDEVVDINVAGPYAKEIEPVNTVAKFLIEPDGNLFYLSINENGINSRYAVHSWSWQMSGKGEIVFSGEFEEAGWFEIKKET